MSKQVPLDVLMREASSLEERIGQLRQTAALPDPDLRTALDAALVELELALTTLRTAVQEQSNKATLSTATDLERRMLRKVFQDAPVPLFLLERDGTIRRINRQAAALAGTSPGYAAGKPFTSLCELPQRAALSSQLAGVVRTGRRRQVTVRFLGKGKKPKATSPTESLLSLTRTWIRGEPEPLLLACAATGVPVAGEETPQEGPTRREPAGRNDATCGTDGAVAALVHRMDLLTAATELLLEDRTLSESVAIRRCARLLATELADWVIFDLVDDQGELRRHVVMGPDGQDQDQADVARKIEDLAPAARTLPAQVRQRGQATVISHLDDLDTLGTTPGNLPVCGLLNATSVLSVPLNHGGETLGVVTLTGSGEHAPFDLVDLGFVERLARLLTLVLRGVRVFRRRAEVTEALQESLLPRELPRIDGVDIAAKYLAVTRGVEVGGDFYDVFATPQGFGLVLGDVCGKGEEAAAVTATARHGVRLLSRWDPGPADVMSKVNEALMNDHDRFVTAIMVNLEWTDHGLRATLASAGHQPAVILRRHGVARTATGGGIPLGLFAEFSAGTETIDLEPGDTLFVHSDGVVDACDPARREFGHERLVETLIGLADRPVAELVAEVERVVMDFCADDLRDDVSMLALRVLRAPP